MLVIHSNSFFCQTTQTKVYAELANQNKVDRTGRSHRFQPRRSCL